MHCWMQGVTLFMPFSLDSLGFMPCAASFVFENLKENVILQFLRGHFGGQAESKECDSLQD